MKKLCKKIIAIILIAMLSMPVVNAPITVSAATVSDIATSIINVAKGYEGWTKDTFINNGYSNIASEWCVWFLRHCAEKVGAGSIFSASNNVCTFYSEMINNYGAQGFYYSDEINSSSYDWQYVKSSTAIDNSFVPQVGDIYFLHEDGWTGMNHVGFVIGTSADNKTVYIVAGNNGSSKVVAVRNSASNTYYQPANSSCPIVAYIRPNYASLANSSSQENNTVNVSSIIADMVSTANGYIGWKAADFNAVAGTTVVDGPWCVWFVRKLAADVGVSDVFSTSNYTTTFFSQMIDPNGAYKATGYYTDRAEDDACFNNALSVEATGFVPQAGDILCIRNLTAGSVMAHMGFVIACDGNKVIFVDGNGGTTYPSWDTRPVRQHSYSLSSGYICGYIRPNYANSSLVKNSDIEKPVISDVKVTVDCSGYTISCVATDNKAITDVRFPTWTTNNGQDDIAAVYPSGTLTNGRWVYRVNCSDHNNEGGEYNTHIYAYDSSGNYTSYTSFKTTVDKNNNHGYGNWSTITKATCTSAGSKSRSCTTCGAKQTEAIAATGHSVNSNGVCTNCNKVLSAKINSATLNLVSQDRKTTNMKLDVKLSATTDVDYKWTAECTTSGKSYTICDWTKNKSSISWNPAEFGEYVVTVQARVSNNTSSTITKTMTIYHNPNIKGKCQMPWWGEGGGYLIGVESYENPNQSYQYEMLILDCTLLAQGKPAWVYTTNKFTVTDGAAGWCVWQPQYGYYWTLFRVYDAQGNMIDQACYPFVNAY